MGGNYGMLEELEEMSCICRGVEVVLISLALIEKYESLVEQVKIKMPSNERELKEMLWTIGEYDKIIDKFKKVTGYKEE